MPVPKWPLAMSENGNSSFPSSVTGKVGAKEIERLIQKLEIDTEILADQADGGGAMKRPPTEAA
jgi:hypothetical protein